MQPTDWAVIPSYRPVDTAHIEERDRLLTLSTSPATLAKRGVNRALMVVAGVIAAVAATVIALTSLAICLAVVMVCPPVAHVIAGVIKPFKDEDYRQKAMDDFKERIALPCSMICDQWNKY